MVSFLRNPYTRKRLEPWLIPPHFFILFIHLDVFIPSLNHSVKNSCLGYQRVMYLSVSCHEPRPPLWKHSCGANQLHSCINTVESTASWPHRFYWGSRLESSLWHRQYSRTSSSIASNSNHLHLITAGWSWNFLMRNSIQIFSSCRSIRNLYTCEIDLTIIFPTIFLHWAPKNPWSISSNRSAMTSCTESVKYVATSKYGWQAKYYYFGIWINQINCAPKYLF